MSKSAANPQLTYETVSDLLPGYSLGVLEPEEMLAIDEYLRLHQGLLFQVERSDETVAHLALTAPAVTPSPAVKDALMARVHSALSQEETIALRPLSATQAQPVERELSMPRQRMTWLDQLRYELGGSLTWPASTAVAMVACLLLGVLSVTMWRNQRIAFSRLDTAQQSINVLVEQNSQLQSTNAQLNQQLQARDAQIALFAGGMRSIALEGTEFAPQAGGAFYTSRTGSVLILNGLAPLPADQTYELWLIPSDGDPVSAGLVQVTADGATVSQIPMPSQPQEFAAVGLSIEPAGGSPQPTGPIVLLGTVSS